ncbi:MAG: hypothetical protein RIC95_05910 [Vicingaceae bacterium]
MKKLIVSLAFVCVSISFFLSLCGTTTEAEKRLSAGQTLKPNTNYSVADPSAPDYEAPHNTRVKDPYFKVIPKLSPKVPVQLRPHSRLVMTDVEDRTFFDYFAWQTFVGLVWPADQKLRGVSDQSVTKANFANYNSSNESKPNRVPIVMETFRTFDDAFPGAASITNPPPAWNAEPYSRPFDLDLTSKGHNPTALDEAFSSPLIDQNRQYVRYGLQLNEVMYEFIRQNQWYLKENLPKSPTQAALPPLPVDTNGNIISLQQPQTNTTIQQTVYGNSIELKTSWRLMITAEDTVGYPWRKVDDLSRYFVSTANVSNAVTGEIMKNRLVGLVGLHIVVKTPQFTQGIWSSFEHVDNLEAPAGIRPSFHDTSDTFYPQGFSYQPKAITSTQGAVKEEDRTPVEVSRIYKIPTTPVGTSPTLSDGLSTVGLNKAYQKLFKGTVWQYYQLVITQWPTDPTSFYAKPFLYPRGPKPDPNQPDAIQAAYQRAVENATSAYPRWAGLPIPQTGSLNATMETYFQNPDPQKNGNTMTFQPLENTSCMGCHYGASDMDFSWGLKLRTYPQGYNQGRINQEDTDLLKEPANVK